MLQRESERQKRKAASRRKAGMDEQGEFDDLVSALKSGEVFEKDKFQKRNRGRRQNNAIPDGRERVGNVLMGRM